MIKVNGNFTLHLFSLKALYYEFIVLIPNNLFAQVLHVHAISDSFYARKKTTPDRDSVHT